jgi:hypothetical protein
MQPGEDSASADRAVQPSQPRSDLVFGRVGNATSTSCQTEQSFSKTNKRVNATIRGGTFQYGEEHFSTNGAHLRVAPCRAPM